MTTTRPVGRPKLTIVPVCMKCPAAAVARGLCRKHYQQVWGQIKRGERKGWPKRTK